MRKARSLTTKRLQIFLHIHQNFILNPAKWSLVSNSDQVRLKIMQLTTRTRVCDRLLPEHAYSAHDPSATPFKLHPQRGCGYGYGGVVDIRHMEQTWVAVTD